MRSLSCRRMGRMIPLYVAGDLVGGWEREAAEHFATCEGCRGLAEEFAESGSLLAEGWARQEFDAEFYARIRSAVLAEITHDRRLSRPQLFSRRWIYAASFGLALTACGFVFQQVKRLQPEAPQGPGSISQVNGQLTLGPEAKSPSSSPALPRESVRGIVGQKTRSHEAVTEINSRRTSGELQAQRKPDKTRTNGGRIEQAMRSSTIVRGATLERTIHSGGSASSLSGSASTSDITRIEIQTADPNIKIIWLAAQASRGSKAINRNEYKEANDRN